MTQGKAQPPALLLGRCALPGLWFTRSCGMAHFMCMIFVGGAGADGRGVYWVTTMAWTQLCSRVSGWAVRRGIVWAWCGARAIQPRHDRCLMWRDGRGANMTRMRACLRCCRYPRIMGTRCSAFMAS